MVVDDDGIDIKIMHVLSKNIVLNFLFGFFFYPFAFIKLIVTKNKK